MKIMLGCENYDRLQKMRTIFDTLSDAYAKY
jgi:hypothetical protein